MVPEPSASLELGLNAHIAHIPPFDSKFALQPISLLAYWLVKTKNVTFRGARLFAWGVGLFFFFFFFFFLVDGNVKYECWTQCPTSQKA